MKRTLSVLLAALLLSATACSSEVSDPETAAAPDVSSSVEEVEVSEETAPEETEPEFLDHLPEDLDFGGTDCIVLSNDTLVADVFCEEMTGEPVKDALFERSKKLEDRLNIRFTSLDLPHVSGTWKTAIAGSVQAADGAYDIVSPDYWWGFETEGYYIDVNTLPYFDFSQPCWCAGWNDNNEINGKRYSCVGYFQLDLILDLEAMFFNKDLIADFGLEDPYELVKEDKM